MVKRYKKESDNTILIIMIITFIVSFLLLLFFINYLDQLYKETERYREDKGELGSSGIFANQAINPIYQSKEILETRFGIYGTILFFAILLLFIISAVYLFSRIRKKINEAIKKEEQSNKIDISIVQNNHNK